MTITITPSTNNRRSLPCYPMDLMEENSTPSSLPRTVNLLINKITKLEGNVKILNDSITDLVICNEHKQKRINILEKKVKELTKSTEDIDVNLNSLDQYGRREHLELVGVNENIPQKELEQFVLDLLEAIGVKLTKRDLVAVHRIGKFRANRKRNVIIKFLNRKDAIASYKNRYKLKKLQSPLNRIFITENLCPAFRAIFNSLYKHYKENTIYDVWTVHGHVYAAFGDDEEGVEVQTLAFL